MVSGRKLTSGERSKITNLLEQRSKSSDTPKTPTLQDISVACGVSRATVKRYAAKQNDN